MAPVNWITLTRIAIIPFLVSFIVKGNMVPAAILFGIAILTDALDGLFARILKQETPLGSFLDPLADKLLLVSSFVSLSFVSSVNWWITGLVFIRELIMAIAWLILRLLHLQGRWVQPSLLGKVTIATQMAAIFACLLNLPFTLYILIIMILLTFVATIDYLIKVIGVRP